MLKVGITGGMGCGKSTVVAEFGRLGVPCFVCDQVAAHYYHEPDFLHALHGLFGDGVFAPDGGVDKRAVAARVFADRQLLEALNALVHPRVMDDFDRFCLQHATAPYVLFESAILYDYGLERMMDRVVCVYLDLGERLRRLRVRDGVGEEALLARIAHQLPAEEVMRRADYVILNYEGNPRARQVRFIDEQLRKLIVKSEK